MNIFKYICYPFFISIILSGCEDAWNCTEGEGPVVTRTLALQGFSSIKLSGSGRVYIKQGAEQEVIVEGQENMIDELNTNISNGTWDIRFRDYTGNHRELVYYITLPEINLLEVSGSGDIIGDNTFKNAEAVLKVTGSGSISADLEATTADMIVTGSGKITVSGEASTASATITGSGELNAYPFAVKAYEIEISGSGNASVTATEALRVKITGSGSVNYKGSPTINSTITGSGKVNNR